RPRVLVLAALEQHGGLAVLRGRRVPRQRSEVIRGRDGLPPRLRWVLFVLVLSEEGDHLCLTRPLHRDPPVVQTEPPLPLSRHPLQLALRDRLLHGGPPLATRD